MDKIEKFIKRLSKKQAIRIGKALLDIVMLDLKGYDVKKMKGAEDLYRMRIGDIRIVFRKNKNNGIPIDIAFRGKIYKKYG